jgi:hypothetical protein
MGHLRWTRRLEPVVCFPHWEPPSVNHRIAGRRMTSAAQGADGIKEANHAHRDPIICRLCQGSSDLSTSAALSLAGPLSVHLEDLRRRARKLARRAVYGPSPGFRQTSLRAMARERSLLARRHIGTSSHWRQRHHGPHPGQLRLYPRPRRKTGAAGSGQPKRLGHDRRSHVFLSPADCDRRAHAPRPAPAG